MATHLVTVATFGDAYQAQICRATLSASGVRSFVSDEHISTLNPHYMGAAAGIRVQVRKVDAPLALEILSAVPELADDEDEDEGAIDDGPRCPGCGARYAYYEWSFLQRLFLILLAGLPLFFLEKKWHCRRCDYRFRLAASSARAESPYRRSRGSTAERR